MTHDRVYFFTLSFNPFFTFFFSSEFKIVALSTYYLLSKDYYISGYVIQAESHQTNGNPTIPAQEIGLDISSLTENGIQDFIASYSNEKVLPVLEQVQEKLRDFRKEYQENHKSFVEAIRGTRHEN